MKRIKLIILISLIAHLTYAQTNVQIQLLDAPAEKNYKVGIRGNEPPLSWEKTYYLSAEGKAYTGNVSFEKDLSFFEYKYVVEDDQGNIRYELDGQENRLGIFGTAKELSVSDTFDIQPSYDVRTLPPLSPEKLQEDAEILGKALWELHPGVERYQDSAGYFSRLQELKATFDQPRTYAEAYKEISQFTASLKCGHTYANPFNQTDFINTIILNQQDKLPFGIEWLEGRLFITRNASEVSALEPGTEIKAINEVPVGTIADRLLKLTKGDGSNEAKRYNDLGVIGYDSYEVFDIYFPLVVPPIKGSYALTVINPDGATRIEKVSAITRKDRNELLREKYPSIPDTAEETWAYEVMDGNIAYLKMGTFAVWNFEMDWKKFLASAFKEFDKRKADKLIIDVRGNEGGADEVLEELLQYIQKEKCTVKNFEERLRYAVVPEELRPYLFTWDSNIFDFRGKVEEKADGFYGFKNAEGETTYKRGRKAFDGEIFLLINAANSSGTFYLARHFKQCQLGTLAGETTGGSKKGINGGNLFFLRLPNSMIEVDIPVFGQFDDVAADGGIEPDLRLERSPEDIRSGKDGQLEELLVRLRE